MQTRSIVSIILLSAILVFAFFVRFPTFKLPHDNGDQIIYLGLAMKLDKFGFSEYKLHGVDVKTNKFILGVFPSLDAQGGLLRGLVNSGAGYYDEPLFHSPYLFPYTLMFAHRIFAHQKPYLALDTTARDEAGRVYSKDADKTWFAQFYAVIIPFAFSLLFILTTYFAARMFLGEKAALISAFLISISPIEILCSQKIWADTMLSFFVVLTVLLFFLAKEKNNLFLSFAAGIAAGSAVLLKLTGAFIIIVILIFHLWQHRARLIKFKTLHRVILDRHLLVFGLAVLLITFHWFFAIHRTYSTFIYRPARLQLYKDMLWFKILDGRPRFLHIVAMPSLVPLFALAYFAIIAAPFKRLRNQKKAFLIIWALTLLIILTVMKARENRYMLPAYPALAMLTADVLERIGNFINSRFKSYYGDIFIVAVLLACAFWSVPIGVKHALANVALIFKPF